MTDVFSSTKRSDIMKRIQSTDTSPELRVRRELHALGFRYRLHDASLPGKPDLVLPKYKAAVQVRGCFWHLHDCRSGRIPKSNEGYWHRKLNRNRLRDERNDAELRRLGWRLFVIWECETKTQRAMAATINVIQGELTAVTY